MNKAYSFRYFIKIVSTLFFCCIMFTAHAVAPWTWCYTKKFVKQALKKGDQAFTKKNIPLFSQLIFSWNSLMPRFGGFRFLVRVRYADTQKWSDWQRMAEWSSIGSKTFYGQHDDGLEYCYVRLELPRARYADGFQIKVEPCRGAPLALIKMLAVSTSCISSFATERARSYAKLPSVHIQGVPAWSQFDLEHPKAPVLCSPTSLCVLASYLQGSPFDPVAFADGVYDSGLCIYGSWLCNIAYAFHATNGQVFFHVQRLHDFRSLMSFIQKDIPVVVSVRGSLTGAPKSYPGGHLLTVVGFDSEKQRVLCHDSAVRSGSLLKEYPLKDFLLAWENSQRLAYVGDPT